MPLPASGSCWKLLACPGLWLSHRSRCLHHHMPRSSRLSRLWVSSLLLRTPGTLIKGLPYSSDICHNAIPKKVHIPTHRGLGGQHVSVNPQQCVRGMWGHKVKRTSGCVSQSKPSGSSAVAHATSATLALALSPQRAKRDPRAESLHWLLLYPPELSPRSRVPTSLTYPGLSLTSQLPREHFPVCLILRFHS